MKVLSKTEEQAIEVRGGAGVAAQLAVLGCIAVSMWALSEAAPIPSIRLLVQSHLPIWVPASAIIFWRWGWALVHWTRSALYRYWKYPRLQKEAALALTKRGPVTEVAIVLVTYKERPEVTRRVIGSVVDELGRVQGLWAPPLVVAVTGTDADDDALMRAFEEGVARLPAGVEAPEIVVRRGADGKRDALAKGLEVVLERKPHSRGVFVMMDGDTRLEPGALTRSLPLFRLTPDVYATTTNEHAKVQAPSWFSEWIHLRHGQRHLYYCSIALSDRLLCLTGRYSIFRAAALDPAFIEIVRNDNVTHWLWGRYQLLSGDDKSTWFYLLSRGRRLLYVPDVSVVTYEVVAKQPFLRAYHNLRRWGGNMVRNSERAISVGPFRLGLFCWWSLIDQRLSIFTTLIGPTAVAYMIFARHRVDLVAAYLLWVLCSRLVRSIPSWVHGRRISFLYAPLAVVFDWAGALVKIWVIFFPARQYWLNRGARELDSTRGRARVRDRRIVSSALLGLTLTVYVLAVGQLVGSLPLIRDSRLLALEEYGKGAQLWAAASLIVAAAALVVFRLRDASSRTGLSKTP